MPFNPDAHRRRSIRLPGFDYASPGAYYVTIVTRARECLFGDVVDGVMMENDVGRMIWKWVRELPRKFRTVTIDSCVVMPNHIHVVIWIVGADLCVCPDQSIDREPGRTHRCAPTLGSIVQWFKTMTTNESIRTAGTFRSGMLWQRNYHERIIRTHGELNRTRQYIIDNPAQWHDDLYVP
ncbi:hypothetical protein EPO33_03595 [Patescibacteria group bacterium]|nr:MAG: hypothetical protein EPO33_03595 [Patescibacteria group bacterium]